MEATDDARPRFEALAASVHTPVLRYLLRRTDDATAADVLAEVLVVLWRRLDDLPDEPLPWCYRVAANCLANATRTRRRQQRLVHRIILLDPPRDTMPPNDAGHAQLRQALVSLPPGEAELLRLWAWEQLGPGEIATVMGITPNAVSIRLTRAKAHLRVLLDERDGTAPDMSGVKGDHHV